MTTHTPESAVSEAQELSTQEGVELFDAAARRHLGMSGEEFLVARDRGHFAGEGESIEAMSVGMLIPLVR